MLCLGRKDGGKFIDPVDTNVAAAFTKDKTDSDLEAGRRILKEAGYHENADPRLIPAVYAYRKHTAAWFGGMFFCSTRRISRRDFWLNKWMISLSVPSCAIISSYILSAARGVFNWWETSEIISCRNTEHDYGTAGYLVNHPDTNVAAAFTKDKTDSDLEAGSVRSFVGEFGSSSIFLRSLRI